MSYQYKVATKEMQVKSQHDREEVFSQRSVEALRLLFKVFVRPFGIQCMILVSSVHERRTLHYGWRMAHSKVRLDCSPKKERGTTHKTQDTQHSKKAKMCALFSERGRAKHLSKTLKRIVLKKYHF